MYQSKFNHRNIFPNYYYANTNTKFTNFNTIWKSVENYNFAKRLFLNPKTQSAILHKFGQNLDVICG